MLTILILQANPRDQGYRQLKNEYLSIEGVLREVGASEHRIVWDAEVRSNDLPGLLQQNKPDVVHFSGHGSDSGELLFEDNQGNTAVITSNDLETLFSLLGESIKCVILNSCYSVLQAEAISKTISCVIGMTAPISDIAANEFASIFYRTLGSGSTIKQSFDVARAALSLRGHGEEAFPMLYERTSEIADTIRLFLKPRICASFVLDKSQKPMKRGKEYRLEVWIENAPTDVIEVVYHYNYPDVEDAFEVLANNGTRFLSEASLYGNIQIRAMLWWANKGIGIVRMLSEALTDFYEKNSNKSVQTALQTLKKQ